MDLPIEIIPSPSAQHWQGEYGIYIIYTLPVNTVLPGNLYFFKDSIYKYKLVYSKHTL